MKRIQRTLLVAVVLSFAVLAGCGGDDEPSASTQASPGDPAEAALVEAAKKEGKVVWYNAQNPERAQEIIDAFQEKYGIEVEALRLSGSQMTQRYTADAASGNVPDAIAAAVPGFFDDTSKQGEFQALAAENEPAFADWPESAVRYDGTTALVGTTPWNVVINTERVETPPTSWEDLLAPEYKGNIVFVDPRIVPTALGVMDVLYDELGPEYLERLGKQDLRVVESSAPGMQSLAAGEVSVLIATEPTVAEPLIDEGAPLDSVLVTPVSGTEMLMAISKDAPHPNAARLLMNYMLSADGQAVTNAGERVSPLPDVPNTMKLPDGYVEADLKQAEGRQDEIFQLLGLD